MDGGFSPLEIKAPFISQKLMGQFEPSSEENIVLINGCKVPIGSIQPNNEINEVK